MLPRMFPLRCSGCGAAIQANKVYSITGTVYHCVECMEYDDSGLDDLFNEIRHIERASGYTMPRWN